MIPETEIGGEGGHAFPSTSWSLIRQAADLSRPGGRERLGQLLSTYWKPVYRLIRAQWGHSGEDAKDLTQGFFALLLEGDYLSGLAPRHGTFRGYLKTALTHFLVDDQRKREALKRGGGIERLPLDVFTLEDSLADPSASTPEELFDREWVSSCMAEAVRRLRETLVAEGRELHYRVFDAYYLQPQDLPSTGPPETQTREGPAEELTHDALGALLGLKAHDVSNYLVYCRKKLRSILRDCMRDYASSAEDEVKELRFVLGEEP